MKKITLDDIKAWKDAQLAETQDVEERQEIGDKAKLQAFYLGALDEYAALTKESQTEFWTAQRQYGYEYKVGHLPEWGNPCADDLVSLGHAYSQGEYEGEAAAERYNEEVLPHELAEVEHDCNRYVTEGCLEKWRNMLKARLESDECGWGENWWED